MISDQCKFQPALIRIFCRFGVFRAFAQKWRNLQLSKGFRWLDPEVFRNSCMQFPNCKPSIYFQICTRSWPSFLKNKFSIRVVLKLLIFETIPFSGTFKVKWKKFHLVSIALQNIIQLDFRKLGSKQSKISFIWVSKIIFPRIGLLFKQALKVFEPGRAVVFFEF